MRKPAKVRNEEAAPYTFPPLITDEQLMQPAILDRIAFLAKQQLDARAPMANPDETQRYLIAAMRGVEHEVFGALFLCSQHKVIANHQLFTGTIDGASVYPREVVKTALRYNAAAVIFYHNHPSGHAEPSPADKQITTRLIDALALVDVRVLDHVVVSAHEAISFASRGLI